MLQKIKHIPDRKLRPQLRLVLRYAGVLLLLLLFSELYLYLRIHRGFAGFRPWVLIFLPSIAMAGAALGGFGKTKKSALLPFGLAAVLLCVYYLSQIIYFEIFGSVYSVSMMGMGGTAVVNFGWGMMGSVAKALFPLAAMTLILGCGIWSLKRTEKLQLSAISRLGALGCSAGLLVCALALLPLGGTKAQSPYAAVFSTLMDSDTAAAKIGVLANTLLEARSYFFPEESLADEVYAQSGEELTADDPGELIEDLEENIEDAAALAGEEPCDPQGPSAIINTSPNIFAGLDFHTLKEQSKDSDVIELCDYFLSQDGTSRSEYTGLFADCNLIYICAESFSSLALDPEVTPTLCRLASGGIVLDNYYNSFKNTTTNGEYALVTGLWPDVSREAKKGTGVGSFPQSASNYMPMGIGTLFAQQKGITPRGYHNYIGTYYERDRSWANLGLECKFMNEGMYFTTTWPSSDLEMMEQSVDDYIGDEQFLAYYMTFSGHGPYADTNGIYQRNIEEVLRITEGRELSDTALGYYACNLELEKAMTYLLDRLEEAGHLEDTVIVLAGDHYPYYLDGDSRDQLAGHPVEMSFEFYKNTCILWKGGMEPLHVDTPCCNVDIFPTILNLFGINYDSRMLAGTDIFSDGIHVAAFYNKSFVTDWVHYDYALDEAEWIGESRFLSDEERDEYLQTMQAWVRTRYAMSLKIEDTDFYRLILQPDQ